jgi:ribosome recycling factor
VGDARTLVVTPWENKMTPTVEKAILTSDLGLNPTTAGNVIRIPLPPLTEDRRRDMIKIVRQEGENARVAIRNIRREANTDYKTLLKEKEITEDQQHQAEEAIQKLTDTHIAEVEKILQGKEAELLEI